MIEDQRQESPRVVLSNSYGTSNVGDQAILVAMLHGLRRVGEIEIDLLSLDPEQSRRRHPEVCAIASGPFKGGLATYRRIRRADLLIIGGGGVIQDSSSLGNLIFHLSRAVIARLAGTCFIGAGLGVGPLKRKLSRWLSASCLSRARMLLVRDEESATLLRDLKVSQPQVMVTADFALDLDFPADGDRGQAYQDILGLKQRGTCLVGLSVRPEPGQHKKGAKRSEALMRQLDLLVKVADSLVRERNAHIVFVSMHPDQDDSLGHEIGGRMRQPERFTLLSGGVDPQTMLVTVGLLDLLVGMRLHSIIFAARSGVPFVAVGYDPKVAGFCRLLGIAEQVLPADEMLQSDALMALIERTWQHREEISRTIKDNLPPLVGRARRNIDEIANILKEMGK